jgi:hypothetical protein
MTLTLPFVTVQNEYGVALLGFADEQFNTTHYRFSASTLDRTRAASLRDREIGRILDRAEVDQAARLLRPEGRHAGAGYLRPVHIHGFDTRLGDERLESRVGDIGAAEDQGAQMDQPSRVQGRRALNANRSLGTIEHHDARLVHRDSLAGFRVDCHRGQRAAQGHGGLGRYFGHVPTAGL